VASALRRARSPARQEKPAQESGPWIEPLTNGQTECLRWSRELYVFSRMVLIQTRSSTHDKVAIRVWAENCEARVGNT
jgi:hypothetical protein